MKKGLSDYLQFLKLCNNKLFLMMMVFQFSQSQIDRGCNSRYMKKIFE